MDQHFLPRPKFTTRRQTALFVRVSTVWKDQTTYRSHPIQLLQDALRADVDKENSPNELLAVWDALKAHADQDIPAGEGTPTAVTLTLSALLTEDAIRLFTSPSGEGGAFPSPPPPVALSETSLLLRQPESPGTSRAPSDWDGFTSAGFGFMDGPNIGLQDYAPPPASTLPGKTKRRSLELGRRGSLDAKGGKPSRRSTANSAGEPVHAATPTTTATTRSSIMSETVASTLLLDEALIDGWADTLTDPVISDAWPTFVLYHLKTPLADPTAAAAASASRTSGYNHEHDHDHERDPPATIAWLVIETYAPAPPTPTKRDGRNGKEKDKSGKTRRSSSRPRFGGFFSSATSVGTTKDKDNKDNKDKEKEKDKDKEGKKKEKDTPGRKSSVGILRGAYCFSGSFLFVFEGVTDFYLILILILVTQTLQGLSIVL